MNGLVHDIGDNFRGEVKHHRLRGISVQYVAWQGGLLAVKVPERQQSACDVRRRKQKQNVTFCAPAQLLVVDRDDHAPVLVP